MLLRLHAFLPRSRANGPGVRAAVWVQGCSLACPGCFNPATHTTGGGETVPVDALFARIVRAAVQGITLSGGEPLQQRDAVLALLARVRRETPLSVILFTGFSWAEVCAMPGAKALLGCVDVLIAGRYVAAERLARGLRGSANKTAHFLTARYSAEELDAVPEAEVIVLPDGTTVASGIEPVK